MKKLVMLFIAAFLCVSVQTFAQKDQQNVGYGRTLNLGLGIGGYGGYYGYVNRSLPVFHINYEIDVARNFTLAPFVSFLTYSNSYYWGNHDNPYRYYSYQATVIPIGLKGSYYFDQLLHAGTNWDFYLAASLGFSLRYSHWENDYKGDENYYNSASPLYLDLHIGTEYHFNQHIGAFLDFSTGVSTIGLSFR